MNADATAGHNNPSSTVRVGVVTKRALFFTDLIAALRADPALAVQYAVQAIEDLPADAARWDVVILDVDGMDDSELRSGLSVLEDFGIAVVTCAGLEHLLSFPGAMRAGVFPALLAV